MDEYKPVTSLVNGEIIKDLLDFCNELLSDPFVYDNSSDSIRCIYCGTTRGSDGTAHHSAADCPVIKYHDVVEKHKRFIAI